MDAPFLSGSLPDNPAHNRKWTGIDKSRSAGKHLYSIQKERNRTKARITGESDEALMVVAGKMTMKSDKAKKRLVPVGRAKG